MSIVVIWKGFAFWPSMTRVASEMKLQFMVLEMKGKDLEALRGNETVTKPPRRPLTATPTASQQYAIAATSLTRPRHHVEAHFSR